MNVITKRKEMAPEKIIPVSGEAFNIFIKRVLG
jgi:hypothetical protein